MDGFSTVPPVPDIPRIHHPQPHSHRNRGNNGQSVARPATIDDIPATPANTTAPVPDTSGNRLSIPNLPPPNRQPEAPPSFQAATAAAGSNVASDAPSLAASVSPAPVLDGRVVLRVGEKQFFTTRATLAESHLLAALLSIEATHDGEHFLDADPDMFAQVLRFLRTRRFPLFYDQATGYDTARYLELLVAAQFYQIPTLETWLTERRYLGAVVVRTEYKAYSLYGTDQITRMHELCWARDERARVLTISEKKGKAYACPAKLWRHDGDQAKCIKARCQMIQLQNSNVPCLPPSVIVMRIVDITALVTRVEIRESVLSAGSYPGGPPPYQDDVGDE